MNETNNGYAFLFQLVKNQLKLNIIFINQLSWHVQSAKAVMILPNVFYKIFSQYLLLESGLLWAFNSKPIGN